MKILIIHHYLNFKATYYNKFPDIFLKKLSGANIEYKLLYNFTESEFDKESKNCDFILNFEELVTKNSKKFYNDETSTLNDLLIKFSEIEKKINVYPPFDFYNLTASKKYLRILPKKLLLPKTKTFFYRKNTVQEKLLKIQKIYQKNNIKDIVVKFGYSGDSDHVFFYDIDNIFDVISNCKAYRKETGKTFLIIVQQYNPEVKNRFNEYRCLFINGKMSPISAFGYQRIEGKRVLIPSKELDETKNPDKKIIKYANLAFDSIKEYLKFIPPFLRIDISWMIRNNKKRYYINEIENLDGTFYFMLPYVPKKYDRLYDKNDCTNDICKSSLKQQYELADALFNYIKNKIKL